MCMNYMKHGLSINKNYLNNKKEMTDATRDRNSNHPDLIITNCMY